MVSEENEVVISGIGGCFPDARGLREFGEKLFASSKLIRPDPARWSAAGDERPLFTGRIPDSDRFDSVFFGIPQKLVKSCDPLMGQMLERTFEAIVDAGMNIGSVKGRNVSVLTATAISDAETLRFTSGVVLDGLGMVGYSRTMMANRISYFFNFNGPSHSLDCSWESAAQALEIAATQIARGEVEAAIVASCNLVAFDAIDFEYNQLNWLSEDGESRPFDAQAQGFARSEGTVCLFLQRSSLAKRRYCSLVKSQSIFLGDRLSGYLRLDDRLGQFLARFYAETSVKPEQVAYVEAAGWSILDKDAEELNAIAAAFKSSPGCPLLVGSVSGNLGLSEAPSAFVSLVKAVIAMETGVIPPTVNYNAPNLDVAALRKGEIKVVTEATPLTSELIAVNGVSFSGTAAHILVERNSRAKQGVDPDPDGLPRLVILQARHEQGAKDVVDKIYSMPPDQEYISMVNDVFKYPVPAYLWRGYAVVPTFGKENVQKVQVCDSESRPVWWVFSGMGSQWPEMGRDLMRLPTFAAAVERCDRALRPKGVDITRILTTEDPSVLDDILNCFVGIATIQVGLVDVLRSVGVSPAGMVGHSVGELGCAYADGCFTAEQTVLAAYARGRASVDTEVIPGMMAAIGLGYDQIKNQVPESIDVACHNASDSCTLSGPTDDVVRYVDELKNQGIFAKAVNAAGRAYHSRYIKDIAPKLMEYLKEVVPEPKQRSARWVSSSVPESRWASKEAALSSAEYHTNNLLSPVLFEEACNHIPENSLVIEIAPRGLLQAILRRSLGQSVNMSLTSRQAESNLRHLLNCIGQLHLHNVPVDVNALYPPVQYPVSRGTPSLTELVTWDHDDIRYQDYSSCTHMLINEGGTQKNIDVSKSSPDFGFWKDHQIHGQIVVPFSQILIYIWKMLFAKLRVEFEDSSIVVEDTAILNNVTTNEWANSTLMSFSPNTGTFEITSQLANSSETCIAMTGKLSECTSSSIKQECVTEVPSEMEEIEGEELYQTLAHLGLELGPQYQLIQMLTVGSQGCYAKIEWTGNLVPFLESLFNIAVFLKSDNEHELYLPSTFIKLTIETEFFKMISSGAIVDVQYNRVTNVLVCSGVTLFGLSLVRAPPSAPPRHSWTEMKLQPYFDIKLTVQELVSTSVRLASETGLGCWADKATTKMTVLVVNGGSKQPPSFIAMIKNSLKQEHGAYCTVQEVEASQVSAAVSGCSGLLVVADSALLPFVMESVPQNCQLYCLTKLTENHRTSLLKLYQPILASLGSAENVALVKRVPRGPDIKIFEVSTSKWLGNLRQLVNSSNEDTCFVVVSRKYDPQVLPTLALEPYAIRLRIFFLLGSAPLSLKSQLFTGQLALGLPVNILSNGVWAFLRPTNISTNTNSISLDCYFKSSISDLKQVECVSLNTTSFPTEESFNDKKLEYVDYSGTNEGGKVMGVGRLDPDGQQMTPDPILRWPVPSGWSMEDAATIPVAYSLAYYCVYLKGRLEPGDSLLVNDALSPVGQAAVAVALHAGALVFASVHDNEQAKQLIDLFPVLKPKQVLVLGPGSSLNAFVRQEVNKGANVVINCLRGKHLQDSVNATAGWGTFLHLGKIKVEDREKIGMLTFLRSTTFCGVTLHNIHNSPYSEKRKMQDLVKKGIQQGIVKPLKNTIVSNAMQKEGLRDLFTSNPTGKIVITTKNDDKKSQTSLKVNPEQICIVAGPDMECILLVAQWLTSFGARKFAVLVDKTDEKSQYCHQFNRLVNQLESRVLMTSLNRLDSPEEADSLLKEVYRMGTVSYIFCVSLAEQRLKILEESSERFGRVQFVSLLCKGASKGAIVNSKTSDTSVRSVLPYLPSLLAGVTQPNGQPKCFVIEDIKSTTYKNDAGKFELPLPRNLDQLIVVGDSCCGAPGFSEVVTLSPGLSHVHQDLLPVFLIPATSPASLQPLTSRLMHPAFCCNPPMSVQSIEQVAEDLMKDLLRVRGKGPFTLVGDSWNSLVALHLGALLEAQGHQVEMFLLEGLPSTVSVAIRALGETTHGIESKLVSTCLNLPDKVKYTQAQMKTVPVEARPTVLRALDSLLGQLTALTHVQAPRHLFQGHVTLVTASQPASTELEDLETYCKQTPSIILTGTEDHQQLIASYKTACAINKNAAFSWNM